jgi:hypothetical protein
MLNVQGGGFYPAYVPLRSDHILFAGLWTDNFARNVDTTAATRVEVAEIVGRWAHTIERHALENPVPTRANRYPLSEKYISMVVEAQAIPATIKKKPIIALFGKDVIIEDLQGENMFLSGDSRAGRWTLDTSLVCISSSMILKSLDKPFSRGTIPIYRFISVEREEGHGGHSGFGAIVFRSNYFARSEPEFAEQRGQVEPSGVKTVWTSMSTFRTSKWKRVANRAATHGKFNDAKLPQDRPI